MSENTNKSLDIKKAVYLGLILTILLTLPVIWHFFTGIPGRGSDTYQAIARTVLVEQHIESDGWLNTFRWQKDANFWGILPLIGYAQAIIGQLAGYNLWWLFSFFLAFLGMWLFAKDITKSDWAATAAGFIFAFAPFHFSQAVATNIGTMHYEWLAWLAFFLHRFMRGNSWRSAMGVAVSVLLIIATEHQLLAFTIIFLIFFFPFLVFLYPENLKKWRFWTAIILGVAVLFIAGAVQFNNIWRIAHSANNYLKPPYSQVEDYSADAVDFLIPARFQTFWGEKFNYLRENTSSNPEGRQSFYLGYLAILLFLLGLFGTFRKATKKDKDDRRVERKWVIFWTAITVVFLILSLGPSLHFGGSVYLERKLPYTWLYNHIPYWNYIRTTSRVFVVVILGWAFLVGIGAKYLEQYYRMLPYNWSDWFRKLREKPLSKMRRGNTLSRKERFYLNRVAEVNKQTDTGRASADLPRARSGLIMLTTAVFVIGLPLEFLSLPVPNLDLSYSKFYDQLAENKDNFSILEIPGSTSYDFGSYSLYTARIHQKNKIDGIDFARTEKGHWTFQRSTPIIESLLYSLPTGGNDHKDGSGGDIINTDYTSLGASVLSFYNIRYVTLSKIQTGQKFGPEEFRNTVSYIEQKLNLSPYYEDNLLKAYAVPQDKKTGYFLALDTGVNESWGPKEGTGNSKGRSAADGAKMRLVNLSPEPINLQINFKANVKYYRYIQPLLDGTPLKTFFTNDFKADYSLPINQLTPGEHSLELKITDQEHQPVTDCTQDRSVKFSHFETTLR